MKRRWYALLFLAALVGLSGQRADASRTPLADIRAAITQPHQLTAATAASDVPADVPNQVRDASTWIVESIIPLGTSADGQPLALISLLVPLSSLDELAPASTRAGPYAAPKTHTRVFCIVQPPLGLYSLREFGADVAILGRGDFWGGFNPWGANAAPALKAVTLRTTAEAWGELSTHENMWSEVGGAVVDAPSIMVEQTSARMSYYHDTQGRSWAGSFVQAGFGDPVLSAVGLQGMMEAGFGVTTTGEELDISARAERGGMGMFQLGMTGLAFSKTYNPNLRSGTAYHQGQPIRLSRRAGLNDGSKASATISRAERLSLLEKHETIARPLLQQGEVAAPSGSMSAELLGDLTRATGREVALLRLHSGQRVLRLGTSSGVSTHGASRIISHTHPSGNLSLSLNLRATPGGGFEFTGDIPVMQEFFPSQRWTTIVGPHGEFSGRLYPR